MLGAAMNSRSITPRLAAGHPSRTALLTAIVRARHYLHDPPPLVQCDPMAERFLPPWLRWFLRYYPLSEYFIDLRLGGLRALEGQVLGRARVVEDALVSRFATSRAQCVILGAGYDTIAARYGGPDSCRFFEVDHPATQTAKRAAIEHTNSVWVDALKLRYVPIDFNADDLANTLIAAGFEVTLPTLVSWLGVVMYLPPAVTLATLTAMRKLLAAGSELYLDILPPAAEGEERALIETLKTFTAWRGEPLLGLLDPLEFAHEVTALGYRVQIITGEEIRTRYFSHLPRRIQPPDAMAMAILGVD